MGSNNLLTRILTSMIFILTASTEAADVCADKITNCRSYGSSSCGSYKDWAQINCAYTCGFCTGPAPVRACVDNRDDCHKYVADICTTASWKTWADDNCAKFCGFCSPSNSTDATTIGPSTPSLLSSKTSTTTVTTIAASAAPPCADGINFCLVYSKRACTDISWADGYCKKFCSRC